MPISEVNFVIERVGSESEQIANNLFQLYAHDFSEFAPLDDERFSVDDDGLFALPLIEKYWTQPNHSFHLIRANGKLAVLQQSTTGRHLAAAWTTTLRSSL